MATPDPHADVTEVRSDSPLPRTARRYAQEVQFAPGTLVAERYRISSILGKGGMGEVFRADDIKLGQTVALKFLPAKLALDPKLLDRLHDEVRLGRQVAHPNVCRIYDIGQWGDAHFVAMEYVDGEDMARLLHRIGRLPHDKAVDITRGIAAGLAAAHAKGILHRDLKPANVMIDSQGDARITDFGLALHDDADQEDVAGTPAYMAPELLEGGAATIQSDLYALGLVMYETFTGKRLYSGGSVQDLRREKSSDITTPSNIVRDIEPSVERVILRCLAHDPAQRPRSAREVILSLPGGDPLAAALAAGETPSPKLIAAAGTEGTLSRRAAWSILGGVVVLGALLLLSRERIAISNFIPFDRSPAVLQDRGEAIMRDLGVPFRGQPIRAFHQDDVYLAWLITNPGKGREKFKPMRNGPPALLYRLEYGVWQIESEVEPLMATAPGRATIEVDTAGRLAFLHAAPASEWKARPLDWSGLLAAAGLDPALLHPVAPSAAPPAPLDARAAWSGTYPGDALPIRVEAAAWQGIPVFFKVTGEWENAHDRLERVPFGSSSIGLFQAIVAVVLFASAGLFAWRNLRLRRGDRQGALRIAGVIAALELARALLTATWPGGFAAFQLGGRIAADSLFWGALIFLGYIALEPYARRRWPELLIAWSRLMSGRVRDPMVGRDVLIGIAGGVTHALLAASRPVVVEMTTGDGYGPFYGYLPALIGPAHSLEALLQCVERGLDWALGETVLLVLLSVLLRKRALAIAAFYLIVQTPFLLASSGVLLAVPFVVASAIVVAVLVVRFGAVAVAASYATFFATFYTPPAGNASWAAPLVMLPYVAVALVALWAFRVSLGDQSPWHPALLDD
jgi:serine/threonine-protein kinase